MKSLKLYCSCLLIASIAVGIRSFHVVAAPISRVAGSSSPDGAPATSPAVITPIGGSGPSGGPLAAPPTNIAPGGTGPTGGPIHGGIVPIGSDGSPLGPPAYSAAVSTDAYNYSPGDLVTISCSGFAAGEDLTIQISHLTGSCTCGDECHYLWTVTADANGAVSDVWYLQPSESIGSEFLLSTFGDHGNFADNFFGNLTGAIWTTDQCGATVDHNVYTACQPPNPLTCEPKSPFLNGGPHNHNCGSAGGLPDGDYYFQVTDPSGHVLLSNDSIDRRQFHVTCGVMTAYANLPGSVASHVVGTGFCPAHDSCPAAITVALWPYDPTPNPGGENKAWVTKVSDYDLSDSHANFGFRESLSKTDNFRCVPTGACCMACVEDPTSFLGTCQADITARACAAMGGHYQGDGSVCDGATCGSCPVACFISCPPDKTVECGDPTDPSSTGSATCIPQAPLANCNSSYSDSFAPGCSHTGVITRTWTCTDTFIVPPISTSCVQTITIVDTTAPTITCEHDTTIECPDTPSFPSPTVSDACDPDPVVTFSDVTTPGNCPQAYSVTRTWTATDACNHAANCSQTITVVDTHAPVITCPPNPDPVNAEPGSCCAHVSFTVTATDACDQNPTVHCDHNSGDCFPVGSTTVTCTAKDACQNTSDPCSFTVTVLGSICGKKFYDANGDGLDNDGLVVANWQIELKDSVGTVIDATLTGADGTYCFNEPIGDYTVCEILPPNPPIGGWFASTPTCVAASVSAKGCRGAANFGNYCLIISPQPCPVTYPTISPNPAFQPPRQKN